MHQKKEMNKIIHEMRALIICTLPLKLLVVILLQWHGLGSDKTRMN
jgi:hypothetical protein